jgi:predicted PurR-regulated permease PerM
VARERRRVLFGATAAVAVVALFVLSAVVTTILLAGAASYVLLPVHRGLSRRGLSDYWSAIATSAFAGAVGLSLLAPFVYVLVVRRDGIRAVLESLRGEVTLFLVGDTPVVFDYGSLREALVPGFAQVAGFVGSRLASLAARLVVFAFVVFGLLYYHDRIAVLIRRLVTDRYYDVFGHVHGRVRDVLYAHFVVAYFGGAVTYLFGLVVFDLAGYRFPASVALIAAVFWVLPVVTVSVFVFVLAGVLAVGGDFANALLVGVLGALFLVGVPEVVVARLRASLGHPERLSAPAYFVGFVGGGLTVGPAGVVLGPIAVTVLLAVADLLADRRTVPAPDSE